MPPVTPTETYAPWFKPLFLAIWTMTMIYLWTLVFVFVRLRRREGVLADDGVEDWIKVVFNPTLSPSLKWIFSAKHRDFDDATMTRGVYAVRALLLVCGLGMAVFVGLLPRGLHRVDPPAATVR